MGYLSTETVTIADAKKLVISFWFRIPAATMTTAYTDYQTALAEYEADETENRHLPPFAGVVPLVTFGAKGTASNSGANVTGTIGTKTQRQYDFNSVTETWSLTSTETGNVTGLEFVKLGDGWDTEPSFIGVWCGDSETTGKLSVQFQLNKAATIHGMAQTDVSYTATTYDFYNSYLYDPPPGSSNPSVDPPARTQTITRTVTDASGIVYNQTETIRTLTPDGFAPIFIPSEADLFDPANAGVEVTPDKWHHVLLSLDLTDDCSVESPDVDPGDPIDYSTLQADNTTSAPKLYLAFDDQNKTERDLSYYWPRGSDEANAVLTPQAFLASLTYHLNDPTHIDANGVEVTTTITGAEWPVSFELEDLKLPTNEKPVGFPADERFVDAIYKVEMAEFQMYSGVSIDTAEVVKRRAFISAEGKPVPTKYSRNEDGDLIADPESPPFLLLSKKPDVAFLKSSGNWINANDLGTVPQEFTATGTIKPYKPDPKLEPPTP